MIMERCVSAWLVLLLASTHVIALKAQVVSNSSRPSGDQRVREKVRTGGTSLVMLG